MRTSTTAAAHASAKAAADRTSATEASTPTNDDGISTAI